MENVAELLKSVDPEDLKNHDKITTTLQTVYPELSTQYRIWDIYFDSDWEACNIDDAVYQITATDKTDIFTDTASDTSSTDSDNGQSVRTYKLTARNVSDDSEIEQLTLKLHAKE